LIATTALVPLFLTGLNVKRFPQQKALFDIIVIDTFLKFSVILQQLPDRKVTGIIGTIQFERRHATGYTVTGETTSLITSKNTIHLRRDVISEINKVVHKILRETV
jgi:hypothetical protein